MLESIWAPRLQKSPVLDEKGALIRSDYARHGAKVKETVLEMLRQFGDILDGHELAVSVTGSAGFGVAEPRGSTLFRKYSLLQKRSIPIFPMRTL